MRISSVGTALPPHHVPQSEFTERLRNYWGSKLPEPRLLGRLHANCGVESRYFVLPLEAYPGLVGFKATNDVWIRNAVELAQTCIARALSPLGLTAADISAIFFASVTGIASPTIDARLINLLPFPSSVKRTPIFGLGCVAGAAGIARASDYVRAFPNQIALLLSVDSARSPGRTTTSPSPTSSPAAFSAMVRPRSSSPATTSPCPHPRSRPGPAFWPPAPPSTATPST